MPHLTREAFLAAYTAYIAQVDAVAKRRGWAKGVYGGGDGLRYEHVRDGHEGFEADQIRLEPEPGEVMDAEIRPYLLLEGVRSPWDLLRPEWDEELDGDLDGLVERRRRT